MDPQQYKDAKKSLSNRYHFATKNEVIHTGQTVEDFIKAGGQIRKFGMDVIKLNKKEIKRLPI